MKLPALSLSLLTLPALVRAEAAAAPEAGSGLFQMLGGMVLVLAMLVGTLWLMKRLSAPRGAGSGLMRVIAGTPVGPRERVVVLEVGGTWLVLGVAPGRVSALAEVPRQEVPPESSGAAGKDFAGWLKQVVDRRNESQPPRPPQP